KKHIATKHEGPEQRDEKGFGRVPKSRRECSLVERERSARPWGERDQHRACGEHPADQARGEKTSDPKAEGRGDRYEEEHDEVGHALDEVEGGDSPNAHEEIRAEQ